MADFAVNTDQLRLYSEQIASFRSEMDSVAVRLGAMQLGSILRIRATTALIGQIGDCKIAVAHHSQNISALATGLSEVADLYDRYERALTEPKTEAQSNHGPTDGTADGRIPEWIRETAGIIGEDCPVIGLGSAVLNIINGTVHDAVEGIGGAIESIGDGIDAIFAADGTISADWASDLFGLNASGIGGFSDALDDWMDGFNFGGQTTTAGRVSTVCNWAGAIFSFVAGGIENYGEHGEMNLRFWGETAVEGVVDFGLSAAAGIAVAAALPAATPAIIVGAVGAGVVWAANAVCEAITGEDIAEHIGNFVCDAAESIGNAIGEAAEATVSAINSVCDWVGGWFR